MRRICRLGGTSRDGNKATRCKVKVKHPWALVCKLQAVKITSTIYMKIMTGIEVNSEVDFPKLWEYCPSAEGMRAIFPQLREISLTIDR